ncbi:hypothetical protein KIMH_04160 [Bombiscardovia apis]|uniref:RCC1-like domain-containing protein n=1 Tax=Bombiscardovia apis TaxID=2932182 RepID=A0ABN6SI27_9BIFI|nr:hypothetical protein KIMH_04160 [Bombiscardovia apis]
MGTGYTTNVSSPIRVLIPIGVRFTQVSAGNYFSLALDEQGRVWHWGKRQDGIRGSLLRPTLLTSGVLPSSGIIQISAGASHGMALDNNGIVYVWGGGAYGENSLPTMFTPPIVVTGGDLPATGIIKILAGQRTSFAIDQDGKLYAWGDNAYGQLGNPTNVNPPPNTTSKNPAPKRVLSGSVTATTKITQVASGSFHTLALDTAGNVHAWGMNFQGELGTYQNSGNGAFCGSTTTPTPTPRIATTNKTSINAGSSMSSALDSNGTIWTWGNNQYGQLGDNRNKTSCAVNYIPSAVNAGSITSSTPIAQISGTNQYILALDHNGIVYGFGSNRVGQLGNSTNSGTNTPNPDPMPTGVATLKMTSVSFDGVAVTNPVKDPATGVWTVRVPLHDVGQVPVSIGWSMTWVSSSWDSNSRLQTTTVTMNQPAVTLHYEYKGTYTVHFDLGGAPGSTPADQYAVIGDDESIAWPNPTPSWEHHWFDGWFTSSGEAWDFNSPVRANMTLTAKWEAYQFTLNPSEGPTEGSNPLTLTAPDPPQGISYSQISAGSSHSLALGSDGNTYAWGNNAAGQLGDGTTTRSNRPVRVQTPAGLHFAQISANGSFSMGLTPDGRVYTWGSNTYGQLGNSTIPTGGTGSGSTTPVLVQRGERPAGVNYTAISAGSYHAMALGSDNQVYTWGQNNHGQLGNNTQTIAQAAVRVQQGERPAGVNYTAVSAGREFSLALGSDRQVYAWGSNERGQLGNNTQIDQRTPVLVQEGQRPTAVTYTAVSAGGAHVVALGSDQQAYAWGDNRYGQLGNATIPTSVSNASARSTLPLAVERGERPAGVSYAAVSAGNSYSAALGSNRQAYTWGANSYSQLGNGTTTEQHTPVLARQGERPTGVTYTSISAGYDHCTALGSDHQAYTWGRNLDGQLGSGNNTDGSAPVLVKLMQLLVTGITFDTTDASPAPVWDASSKVWKLKAPGHNAGAVPVHVHWTLAGAGQTDYDLSYTYRYTLPAAGAIPLQRLTGGSLLGLSALAALSWAAYQLTKKRRSPRSPSRSNPRR